MDDIDWTKLVENASVDPGVLKRQVDLVTLCEHVGIPLEEAGESFKGHCPFHDDQSPSFSVYDADDGTQRCGCFACDFGPSNDVFDMLQRLRGYGLKDAIRDVQEMSKVVRAPEHREARTKRTVVDLVPFVEHAQSGELMHTIASFVYERDLTINVKWLIDEFRLGTTPDGGGVVIPHYDVNGSVTAVKVRRRHDPEFDNEWTPRALSGSRLTELYGVWRNKGHNKVILVEGESDTWTAASITALGDVDVFGLPSGAAARPKREWIEFLADRDVILLFDADVAGRAALKNWSEALGVCQIALLDEGDDVSSITTQRLQWALNTATKVGNAVTSGLIEAPFEGYVRAGDDDQHVVSNFTLHLKSVAELPDREGYQYEVSIQPSGTPSAVTSHMLGSDTRTRDWANTYGLAWNGTIKDCQELLRMLHMQSVFVPRHRGVNYAGYVDGNFVLPEPAGTLGSKSYSYIKPHSDANLDEQVNLGHGPWENDVPAILSRLHIPSIATPVLGWIAAAPLRQIIKQFPVLLCVGTAGSGKSTIIGEMLRAFGFHVLSPRSITSTTPFAAEALFDSTNAIPIWFDEYRLGARVDTKMKVDQLIRDAWEQSRSQKGGMGTDYTRLGTTLARCPAVISGEDMFETESLIERSVIVQLPRVNQAAHPGAHAFERLQETSVVGFGRSYLEWLLDGMRKGTLPSVPDKRERKMQSRMVAEWGYGVLDQFCREVTGTELIPFDGSRIAEAHARATGESPVDIGVKTLFRRWFNNVQVVWSDHTGATCIRLYDFVAQCKKLDIPLSGGAQSVMMELEERYDWVVSQYDEAGEYLQLGPVITT